MGPTEIFMLGPSSGYVGMCVCSLGWSFVVLDFNGCVCVCVHARACVCGGASLY